MVYSLDLNDRLFCKYRGGGVRGWSKNFLHYSPPGLISCRYLISMYMNVVFVITGECDVPVGDITSPGGNVAVQVVHHIVFLPDVIVDHSERSVTEISPTGPQASEHRLVVVELTSIGPPPESKNFLQINWHSLDFWTATRQNWTG